MPQRPNSPIAATNPVREAFIELQKVAEALPKLKRTLFLKEQKQQALVAQLTKAVKDAGQPLVININDGMTIIDLEEDALRIDVGVQR